MKLSIGAVGFAEPHKENSAGWRMVSLMGEERIRLLQLVRDNQSLPDGLFLIGYSGGGYCRIQESDIAWETSGIQKSA